VEPTRRAFLFSGTVVGSGLLVPQLHSTLYAADKKKAKAEPAHEERAEELSPAEDLMREHGVLRRVLLIYSEATQRLLTGGELDLKVVAQSAELVRRFIEDYHEKLEEEFLFPRFRKAEKLVELVDILQKQHQAGRRLTDRTLEQAKAQGKQDQESRQELIGLLHLFGRMYQPHAAREDTVLFPALHKLVSAKEYEALGDPFEEREQKLFGQDGFEKIVDEVAGLEKSLGILDLAQFTPPGS
jgi:hemerythrin-like domain-containing protein